MGYVAELRRAMEMVAMRRRALFMGQTVKAGGSGMSKTFNKVDPDKLLELPVFEKTQLGMAIGMSLAGRHPIVCVYPRINFLLEAMGMFVSELDKIEDYSPYRPRVIIRTAVAHDEPMNPGPQHLGDYSWEVDGLTGNINVVTLKDAKRIYTAYNDAVNAACSTVLVEYMELYDE